MIWSLSEQFPSLFRIRVPDFPFPASVSFWSLMQPCHHSLRAVYLSHLQSSIPTKVSTLHSTVAADINCSYRSVICILRSRVYHVSQISHKTIQRFTFFSGTTIVVLLLMGWGQNGLWCKRLLPLVSPGRCSTSIIAPVTQMLRRGLGILSDRTIFTGLGGTIVKVVVVVFIWWIFAGDRFNINGSFHWDNSGRLACRWRWCIVPQRMSWCGRWSRHGW